MQSPRLPNHCLQTQRRKHFASSSPPCFVDVLREPPLSPSPGIRNGPSAPRPRTDAYAFFEDDDPDAEWSTLARPKKKVRKEAWFRGTKRSGPFQLALAHPRFAGLSNRSAERSCSKREYVRADGCEAPKRRVITFLPPPRAGGRGAEAGPGLPQNSPRQSEQLAASDWTLRRADAKTSKLIVPRQIPRSSEDEQIAETTGGFTSSAYHHMRSRITQVSARPVAFLRVALKTDVAVAGISRQQIVGLSRTAELWRRISRR